MLSYISLYVFCMQYAFCWMFTFCIFILSFDQFAILEFNLKRSWMFQYFCAFWKLKQNKSVYHIFPVFSLRRGFPISSVYVTIWKYTINIYFKWQREFYRPHMWWTGYSSKEVKIWFILWKNSSYICNIKLTIYTSYDQVY